MPSLLGTPISPAFDRAAAEITAAQGTLEGGFAVVFLTDGEGTCDSGAGAAPQAMAWQAAGIPTYVVNVNPMLGGPGATLNDAVALAGGTTAALNPNNREQLDAAMDGIVRSTLTIASCEQTLQGVLSDLGAACQQGEVRPGGDLLACDGLDGFSLFDSQTILLNGQACADLMDGEALSAEFPCDVVAP